MLLAVLQIEVAGLGECEFDAASGELKPRPAGALPGVRGCAGELDADEGLVSDDLCVMPWNDHVSVTGIDADARVVGLPHVHPAADAVADVVLSQ